MSTTTISRRPYRFRIRQALDVSTPLRENALQSIVAHNSSILATGKYHYSNWYGLHTYNGDPGNQSFRSRITTSPNASYITIIALVSPVSEEGSLSILTNTPITTLPAGNTQSTQKLITEVSIQYALTNPGTEIEIYFNVNKAYLLRGVTVFDTPNSQLETTDIGYLEASDYFRNKPITFEVMENLFQSQYQSIEYLRKSLVNNSSPSNRPFLHFSGTVDYSNVFDNTLTGWNANGPGYWVRPSAGYHNSNRVECNTKVLAKSSSGNASIRLVSSGFQSNEVNIGTDLQWYSISGLAVSVPTNYNNNYFDKIDIEVKDPDQDLVEIYSIVINENNIR